MNLSTVFILCALAVAVVLALRSVRRHKGGGCGSCSGCDACREQGECTRREKK